MGAQSFVGSLNHTGTTTINAGTLTITSSTQNGSPIVINGGTLAIQSSTVGAMITGSGGNVVVLGGANNNIGAGNNANTYSSPTLVTGTSTLTQTAANSLSSNSVHTINAGSALVVGNFAGSVKALDGAGTVSLGGASANLTLSDGASQRHTGVISGTGSITKLGTGQQTLAGLNTFTGNTVVSNGTLIGTTSSALGVNSGLRVAGGSFAYQPTAAGSLTLGSGVLNLASGSRIGTAVGGTASQSAITSSGAAVTTGTITVDVYGIPGVAPTAGANNLITAGSGLNGGTYTLGGVYNLTDFTVGGLTRSDTAISITVVSATPLTAAYWKGGFGGANNVWAATDGSLAGNWASDAGGTATPLIPGPGATITFSATGAVNQNPMVLGANINIGGMVVSDASTITLNPDGNLLTLGAKGITVNGGAGAVTLASPITLGAAQGWTNNSANALTVSGAVNNGGFALNSAGTATTVLSGALSGSGGVTTTGGGTLTLSGTNTFNGTVTINGGALLVRNASALGTTTKALVFNNVAGGVLDIDGYDTTVGSIAGGGPLGGNINVGANTLTTGGLNTSTSFGGALSGTGTLVKNGTGNLMLSGTSAATVLMKVNQGAVVLSNTVGTASCGSLTFDNNLSPDVYTISNNQFAAGAMVSFVTDAGDHGRFDLIGTTQTVAGVQTVGYTTIRGLIQNSEALPNSGVSRLVINGSGDYTFGGYFRNQTGTIGLTKDGTGTQTFAGSQITYSGSTTVSNGLLRYVVSNHGQSIGTWINSGATVEFNATGDGLYVSYYGGTLSGSGTFRKLSSSSYRSYLSPYNSVAGALAMGSGGLLDVNSGTLALAYGSTYVSSANKGNMNVASGASFDLWDCSSFTVNALTGSGTITRYYAGSSTLTLGSDNGVGTFGGVIVNGAGTVLLTKNGTGTQTLTGTNTFTGNMIIGGGVLVIGGAGKIGNGSYAGAITNSGNMVYSSSAPQTLGGIISGGGSLTESGPGNLSLTGVNTYTGPTTINGGTLSIDGASQLASGNYSGVITNNASLVVNTTAAQTLGGIISGTGPLTKSSTGTLVLTAANNSSGSVTVSGGTLSLSGANGALTGSSAYTISANATLKLDNTSVANNGDRLNNAGTVTMNGGTLLFSNNGGAANYSESAGTLSINAGINTVVASQAAVLQTSAITFPALTHTPGAVVNFVGTGLGVDNRNRIMFAADPTAILGSWATVNGTDVAIYDASLGIKASPYTDIATLGSVIPNSGSGANIRISSLGSGGNDTLAAATTTIGTLLQNWTSACTVDTAGNNTLQAASIMIGSGAGSLTFGTAANSGTVMANTAGGELVLNNYAANALTINSRIVDNTSASTVNIGGTGTIVITGGNTYSGGTSLNGSTAVLNNNAALGTGTVTMNNGAAINATTAGITLANNPIVLNGNFSFAGTQGMSLGAGAVTLGVTPVVTVTANTLTNAGAISGSGFGLTMAGAGTYTLSGSSANTYTGTTTMNPGGTANMVLSKNAGVVAVPGDILMTGATPTMWMTQNGQLGGNGVLSFTASGNGRLDVFGTSQTLAGLSDATARGVVQNSEAINGAPSTTSGGTLTLTGAGNYSFNGYLRNLTGTLTVNMNGTGTQTLSLTGSGFRIGGGTADVSAFNVNSGTVIVPNNCVFNENGGSAGTLTINGGTFSQTGGGFYMPNGTGGPSYLTVNGGRFISVGTLYTQSSTGTTTINGGTVTFSGQMRLGEGGTGNWVQTGGYASFAAESYLAIGANPATLTVSGGTYDFTPAGNNWFNLGYGTGTATMNISGTGSFLTRRILTGRNSISAIAVVNMSGGTFTASSGDQPYYLGYQGTLNWNQTGGVATFANQEVQVAVNGLAGAGTLNISGGTFQHTTDNWFNLGYGTGLATLNVSGSGYFSVVDLMIGRANATSRGVVNLSGGTISVGANNAAYFGNVGTSTWNQTGGTAIFRNNLIVANSANAATVTMSAGTFTQTGGTLTLGNSSGTATWNQSGGNANFSGGGAIYTSWGSGASTLTISGGTFTQASANWVNIGYGTGVATMNVSGTGYFSSPYFIIARDNTTAQGVVNLSGGTIAIGNNNPCYIGHAGTATWNQTGGLATFGSQVNVAQNISAATITISGGTFTQTAANTFYLGVGTGPASMTVNGGAATLYGLVVGNGGGSVGVLNLQSGTLTVNNAITVGESGSGTFSQTGGVMAYNGAGGLWMDNNGGTATLNLSGGTFTSSSYLQQGVRGAATLNVSGTANVTFPSITLGYSGLAGNGTINLNGGTLRVGNISRANANPGVLNFNGGTLMAGSAGTLSGLSAVNVQNGGAIVDSSTFTYTISDALINGGTGGLTTYGSGTLVLGGANTYAGQTIVNAGTLRFTGNNAYNGDITVNSGTFEIGGGGQIGSGNHTGLITNNSYFVFSSTIANQTLAGTIRGTGSLTKSGTGTLTLAGTNVYSGATVLSTGTLLVTGPNSCSGTITVSGGTLTLTGANGAMTNNSLYSIAVNSILKLDNTSAANNTNRLSDTGTISMNGGTLTIANNAGAVNYSENAGTLSINASANTVVSSQAAASQTNITTFAALTHTPGSTVNFVGTQLGVDARNQILFVGGAPTLGAWATVNGTNVAAYGAFGIVGASYTDINTLGSTIPNSGTSANIRINALGAGGNDTLAAATTTIGTLLQNFTSACTVDTAGINTLQTSAIMLASGQGSLTIGTAANSGTITANAAGGDLVLNSTAANALTLNARIADNTSASTMSVGGTGTFVISGANTYSGGTTLSGGTLVLNNNSALGSGTVTFSAGAINATVAGITLANNPQAWNGNISFTGTQDLNLGSGTVTLGTTPTVTVTAKQLTVGGVIAGSGFGFTKAGAGTNIFSGTANNTYNGLTTVSAGNMVLSKNAGVTAIGGSLTMVNSSSPNLWTTADNQFASGSVLSFSGTGGNSRFDVFGTSQTLAGLNEANALGFVQNSEAINGAPSTTSGGTLTLNGAGTYSFNGYLRNQTGTLTVNMNGTGTQTFSLGGSGFRIGGSYSGDVAAFNVNSGTVIVPNNMVFNENGGSAGTLTINGGTFSQTGGHVYMPNSTGGPSFLTVNGGSFLSTGNLYTQSSTGTTTVNGGTITFGGQMRLGEGGTGNWVQTGGYARFTTESYLAIGANPATMTISGGTYDFAQNGQTWFNLGYGTGTATLNISGTGTFKTTRFLTGRNSASANAVVNMSGGTFTASGATDYYYLSLLGTLNWNHTGGIATFSDFDARVANGAGSATITVSGGTFSHTTANWFNLGYGTGLATLNVSGTGYFSANQFLIGRDNATSRGVVNLSGGTLSIGSTTTAYIGHAGTATWNQTGGSALFQNTVIVANSANAATLTMSSGTFTKSAGQLIIGNSSGTATWSQSGGNATFSGVGDIILSLGSGASTLTLSGGTFTQAAANWFTLGTGTGLASLNVSGTGTFVSPYFTMAKDNLTAQGVVNLSGGTMTIGTGNPCYIGHTGTATWNQTGGVVTFGSNINVAQGTKPATISVSGGTFSQAANLLTLGVSSGTATFNVSGTGFVSLYQLNLGNAGTSKGIMNLNGGTLRLGSGGLTLGTGAGTLSFNGGTLQAGANLTIANSANLTAPVAAGGAIFDTQGYTVTVNKPLIAAGVGPLTKEGSGTLVLTAANTYTGATTNNAGTLMVNGSLAAASAVVVNGGTLCGTGTAAGPVAVGSGAVLSPGNPAVSGGLGTLTAGATTIQSGGTVAIQMLPTSGDRLVSSGAVTLAAGALLTVDGSLNDATTWDIVTGASVTGTFSGLANGDRIPGTQMSIFYRADRVTLQTDNVGTVYMIR